MASHKSAIKAHRQNVENRNRNRQMRSRLRTALKSIRTAVDEKNPARAKDALSETFSLVDKMAGKGIIHDNAAGRYKSRLVKRAAKASSKSA